MISSMQFGRLGPEHLPDFGKHWSRYFILGLALVVLGIFAIMQATFATLVSIVVLGFLIFFAGAVILVDTMGFWWDRWGGFFLHLIIALLYLAVGITLIMNPVEGSISLTLLLGIFYLVVGLVRIFFSASLRSPRWGWSLINGIITFILGVLILSSWPASSLFIIGLFIGIDMVFSGWAYIMASLAGRRFLNR